MNSDVPNPRDVVTRKSALSVDHASSRLVRRGLAVLDEVRAVCLDVDRLIAFESSLFVLAKKWDHSAWGRYEDPAWRQFWSESPAQRPKIWNGRRQVTFFEFHRSGAYIRKVALPLVKLTPEGFTRVQDRDCVAVTIRPHFIYFRECLWMGSYSDARPCHIHYLFSRKGERRAVWSSSDLIKQYLLHHEPTVPAAWLDPDLIDETSLITLRLRHESQGEPRSYINFGEQLEPHASTVSFILASHDAEQWITYVSTLREPSAPTMQTLPIPHPVPTYNAVDLPASMSLSSYLSSAVTASDPRALWLLGDEVRDNGHHERSISRMELDDVKPRVTTYSLPHPYDLIRQGIITLMDDHDVSWMPSEADYQVLKADYDKRFSDEEEQFLGESEFSHSEYEGKYGWLSSWGDDLVVSTYFNIEQHDWDGEVLLLFKVEGGILRAVKRLSPDRMVDLHPRARDKTFADGHLFSAEWEDNDGAYESVIQVTNVNTETVTSFRPEVPEQDVDKANLPK